ncbi:Hypothetical protein D9617_80g101420 [Elsinoe fawcettii]|nr:Hypothetical protein D9617_80g101420 [Elsinoe fawcettii]
MAHFIRDDGQPTTALLGLPRQGGRHSGLNLAETIGAIIAHYNLQQNVGYFMTDNAPNNDVCLAYLSHEFSFKMPESRLRCCGHIFNLCGQAVLFGSDADAFEHGLEDTALGEQPLQRWRRRGPCGKLHNVLYYIDASPQRIDRLNYLQPKPMHLQPPEKKPVYAIVKDVITRCNSFDNAIKRALYLRASINEFCQLEVDDYAGRCRRAECAGRPPPREPSIVRDLLTIDDWTVLEWQRRWPFLAVSGKFFQPSSTSSVTLRIRGVNIHPSESHPQLVPAPITSESHFSTACNLGWRKLNHYYAKLDESPIYVTAVSGSHSAKVSFDKLWQPYSQREICLPSSRKRPSGIASDWFNDDDDEDDEGDEQGDELSQYLAGPRPQGLAVEDSPIPWWLMQRKRWPRLSALALNIFAVPAVSDAPERLYSQAGDAISSRRRLLHSSTLEWLMSLKSWISTGLVKLDDNLFGGPTVSSEGGGKSGDTSLFSGDDEVTVLGKQANSTNNQ